MTNRYATILNGQMPRRPSLPTLGLPGNEALTPRPQHQVCGCMVLFRYRHTRKCVERLRGCCYRSCRVWNRHSGEQCEVSDKDSRVSATLAFEGTVSARHLDGAGRMRPIPHATTPQQRKKGAFSDRGRLYKRLGNSCTVRKKKKERRWWRAIQRGK